MSEDIKKLIDAAQANYQDVMKYINIPKNEDFNLFSFNYDNLTSELTSSLQEQDDLEFFENPTYELIEKQERANELLG